jgi:hypothetical protein
MAATLHEWRQSSAVLTASSTHCDHNAQPGQEKRSLRLSAEALSHSSEQIGRMVELQIDHRAYEDPPTHNLKVTGSNSVPAATFIITHSPSRSNRRDGSVFSGERGTERQTVRLRAALLVGGYRRLYPVTSYDPAGVALREQAADHKGHGHLGGGCQRFSFQRRPF